VSLNSQQTECAEFYGPALFCVANPGSGKTRTLTHAVANRVLSGVDPRRILAVTFTRLAAAEMRRRLSEMGIPAGISVGTFHSICYELIRDHYETLGFSSKDVAVYDRHEQLLLIKEIIATTKHSPSQSAVLAALQHMSATGRQPDDLPRPVESILNLYLNQMWEHNAVDYSLVPYLALQLLRDGHGQSWTDIFVDEVQDLDALQHEAFRLMKPQRIFFVGDPDQLVYGWRNASIELMRESVTQWGATVKVLNTNYRSGHLIIAAANQLIKHNTNRIPKEIVPSDQGPGEVIVIEEAGLGQWVKENYGQGSMAIMARTHNELALVSRQLSYVDLKFEMVGKREKLLEREDVKTALSYLAWPTMPLSPSFMRRVLEYEGYSALRIDEVRCAAKTTGATFFQRAIEMSPALAEFYTGMMESEGLVERMISVLHRMRKVKGGLDRQDEGEMIGFLTGFIRLEAWHNRTAPRLIAWINLRDGQDDVKPESPLSLMTFHAAKGLEFDTAIIAGLSDQTMPFRRAHTDPVRMEEERRLMYVAITRARHRLVLVRPETNPSRFLGEIGHAQA